MTTLSAPNRTASDNARCEVLGRLMLEFRNTELLEGLDCWRDLQGGLVLEWSNGLTAREARELLTRLLTDSGCRGLRAEDLAFAPEKKGRSTDSENWLFLQVQGVEVQFRSLPL